LMPFPQLHRILCTISNFTIQCRQFWKFLDSQIILSLIFLLVWELVFSLFVSVPQLMW
jgi:hypothetical protein